MRFPTGQNIGITYSSRIEGPWPCEKCHQLSQFAERTKDVNRIYCRNERCRFMRIIDKKHRTIVENDGTTWVYDPITSQKVRVR